MQVTAKSRRAARLQNYLFVLLLLVAGGLLAWRSTRFNYQSDWTAGGRRSLSDASVQVLAKVSGPIKFTAFARDARDLRQAVGDMIARYLLYNNDISIEFVRPGAGPGRARAGGGAAGGGGRRE